MPIGKEVELKKPEDAKLKETREREKARAADAAAKAQFDAHRQRIAAELGQKQADARRNQAAAPSSAAVEMQSMSSNGDVIEAGEPMAAQDPATSSPYGRINTMDAAAMEARTVDESEDDSAPANEPIYAAADSPLESGNRLSDKTKTRLYSALALLGIAGLGSVIATGFGEGWFYRLHYGKEKPKLGDITLTNLQPGTITVTVATDATDASVELDLTTILIAEKGGEGSTTLEIDSIGKWTVSKLVPGQVVFEPYDKTARTSPPTIYYTICGKNYLRSDAAKLSVTYAAAAATPPATPEPIAPTANDVTAPRQNPPTATAEISRFVGEGTEQPDYGTLTLIAADDTQSAGPLVVPGEGTWTVDPTGKKISFTAVSGFTGDPTPIRYKISDTAGNASNVATITVGFIENETPVNLPLTGPVVGNIFVTSYDYATDGPVDAGGTQTPGVIVPTGPHATIADGEIDPTKVYIITQLAPVGMMPRSTMTADPVTDVDGKIQGYGTFTVTGQGTWKTDAEGNISFLPDPGFADDPYPVYWGMLSEKGVASNPAQLVIDKRLGAVRDALFDMLDTDNATFWAAFEAQVVTPAPPVPAETAYAVTELLEATLLKSMTRADRMAALGLAPDSLSGMDAWQPLGDIGVLYSLVETYAAGRTDLDPDNIATRYVRLNVMRRAWVQYFAMLDRMMQKT